MSKKITLNNVYNFIEGNSRMILKDSQPTHLQEQFAYRMLLCEDDCAKQSECIICGCNYPGRIYTSISCNKDRFPDLMSALEWDKFKKDNNVK